MCYERHPESMRTVPWLRPAGRDSVSAASACVFQTAVPLLRFSSFNLPQHRSKNPSLLVFYATQHRSKTCPSCVLRHPTSLKILPFLCFRSSQKSADQKTQEGQAKSGHQNSSPNRNFSIENPSLLVFYANWDRSRTLNA